MTPECCSCVSAERLRRPSGVSEQGLLGTRGCDYSHEALWTPGTAQHLYPRVSVRGLDQEGHGDGVERRDAANSGLIKSKPATPLLSDASFTSKTINSHTSDFMSRIY